MMNSYTSSSLSIVVAVGFILLQQPNQVVAGNDNVCMLCEEGVNGLHYPDAIIKSDGTTCTELALETAVDYSADSDQCFEQIQAWRQICCGDDEPVDVEVTEVFDEYPDIDSLQTLGPYNKCDLCRDGDYPSASSMVINMLYIGPGTCPQYWKAGQQGLIPNHLCDPLQYFAYEPCGCGEFSTNLVYPSGGSGSGSDTTSSSNGNSDSSGNSNNDDAWWSGADGALPQESDSTTGGGGNSDKDDDEAWWAGANGGSNPNDDLWWAGADSASDSSTTSTATAIRQPTTTFLAVVGLFSIVLVL